MIKIEINYDPDTASATISINGGKPSEWQNAELAMKAVLGPRTADTRTVVAQTISFSAARAAS